MVALAVQVHCVAPKQETNATAVDCEVAASHYYHQGELERASELTVRDVTISRE